MPEAWYLQRWLGAVEACRCKPPWGLISEECPLPGPTKLVRAACPSFACCCPRSIPCHEPLTQSNTSTNQINSNPTFESIEVLLYRDPKKPSVTSCHWASKTAKPYHGPTNAIFAVVPRVSCCNPQLRAFQLRGFTHDGMGMKMRSPRVKFWRSQDLRSLFLNKSHVYHMYIYIYCT